MPRFTRRRFATLLVAAPVLATGHRVSAEAASASLPVRNRVAVSMPLLRDIVQRIGGDAIDAFSVMPENADPHTWEPTPNDMAALTDADAFVCIGANLEPFIEAGGWRRAVRAAGIPQLEVATLVDRIVVDQVIDHGDHVHDLRGGDPHFWQDPQRVIQAVPGIVEFLVSLAPENEAGITASADAYSGQVTALDAELAEAYANIPENRRTLVVFHDAFRYFAERYAFTVAGVVLANPDAEASAKELIEIQQTMEEQEIDVIFAEPQFNTDVLEVIAASGGYTIAPLLSDAFAGLVCGIDAIQHGIDRKEFGRDVSCCRQRGRDVCDPRPLVCDCAPGYATRIAP